MTVKGHIPQEADAPEEALPFRARVGVRSGEVALLAIGASLVSLSFGLIDVVALSVAAAAAICVVGAVLSGSRFFHGCGVVCIAAAALVASHGLSWPVALLINATGGVLAVAALVAGELSFRLRRASTATIDGATLAGIAELHLRVIAASLAAAGLANVLVGVGGSWPGWALVVVLVLLVAAAIALVVGATKVRDGLRERRAAYVR